MDGLLHHLVIRANETADTPDCTKDTCAVDQSIYGYRPDLPASILFIALFGISCVAHSWQGYLTRAWSFTSSLAIGTLLEAIGMSEFHVEDRCLSNRACREDPASR